MSHLSLFKKRLHQISSLFKHLLHLHHAWTTEVTEKFKGKNAAVKFLFHKRGFPCSCWLSFIVIFYIIDAFLELCFYMCDKQCVLRLHSTWSHTMKPRCRNIFRCSNAFSFFLVFLIIQLGLISFPKPPQRVYTPQVHEKRYSPQLCSHQISVLFSF